MSWLRRRGEPPPLGFGEAAIRAFTFLTTEHGLRLMRREPGWVEFGGLAVVVAVQYDRQRGELDCLIGPVSREPGQPVTLYGLMSVIVAAGQQADAPLLPLTVTRVEELPGRLEQLAQLTRQFAYPLIAGDIHLFALLEASQRQRAYHDWLERVRRAAEQAWNERDFTRAVGLYSSIQQQLSTIEARKLDFARRQSQAPRETSTDA
jgi:hypothetical protein